MAIFDRAGRNRVGKHRGPRRDGGLHPTWVLEFLPPTDFAPRSEFGFRLYWLRAVLKKGNYAIEPKTSGLLLNTVMARHATRIENEILGSSDGSKNQRFRTSLAPVLEGQRLEVRELEMPSPTDQDAIRKETGEDAI